MLLRIVIDCVNDRIEFALTVLCVLWEKREHVRAKESGIGDSVDTFGLQFGGIGVFGLHKCTISLGTKQKMTENQKKFENDRFC